MLMNILHKPCQKHLSLSIQQLSKILFILAIVIVEISTYKSRLMLRSQQLSLFQLDKLPGAAIKDILELATKSYLSYYY